MYCVLELSSNLRKVSQCMERAFSLLKAPSVLIYKLVIVRVLIVGALNKEVKLRKFVDCSAMPATPALLWTALHPNRSADIPEHELSLVL